MGGRLFFHIKDGRCETPAVISGEGRIRTSVGVSRQIYSLLRLATSVPLLVALVVMQMYGRKSTFFLAKRREIIVAPQRVLKGQKGWEPGHIRD